MSPHVVFIAVPALGHVLPLLYLAHKAASSGILSTFIASDVPLSKLKESGDLEALEHSNLRIAALPHEGSITWNDMTKGVGGAIMTLYHQMIAPTEQNLRALVKGEPVTDALTGTRLPAVQPITRVVASPFVFFGPPIAKELGIKWTTFMDTGVLGAVVTIHLAHRAVIAEERGDEDLFISEEEGGEGQALVLGDYMTVGEPNEVVRVFGEARLTTKSPTIWLAKGFAELVAASDDLLVNTSEHLDAGILPLLRPFNKATPVPIFPIGSVQSTFQGVTNGDEHLPHDVASFLERQKPGSVVYIAMGSGNTLPLDEAIKLVHALKSSKVPFVWARCVLTATIQDGDGQVARGVLDGLVQQGQGLVLDWVKQQVVLASGAVGLFVSHAGWNSILESLTHGVPLLMRPFGADHPLNARAVEEKYHAGRHFDVHTIAEDLEDFASGRGGWWEYQNGAARARRVLEQAWEGDGASAKAWSEWTSNL